VTLSRLWLLVLVSLAPFRLQGAPLTFGQALELALNRKANTAQTASGAGQSAGAGNGKRAGHSAGERFCPVHLEDYAGLAAQLASANEMGLPPGGPLLSASPAGSSAGAFALQSRRSVILCTALLYAKLQGIQAQERVLGPQQDLVLRLIDIESRRVSAEVDPPLLLTQAKLLRARTRMESGSLSTSERDTRIALSTLIGLPPDQPEAVESSIPPLPEDSTTSLENREVLRRLVAYRDIVQLDYVSDFMTRLKVTHDMALGKASIGSLVAAHISEEMQFIALLQFNDRIRAAKVQFMGASGDLENWAFGRQSPIANQSSAPPQAPASDSSASSGSSAPSAPAPSILSILISPAIRELQVGRSQQYSAIATYTSGGIRDATTDAVWSCSTDTGAVLSSTGLLTGLSPGVVTVQVEFQGIQQSRKLSVTGQPVDEYLAPDRRDATP